MAGDACLSSCRGAGAEQDRGSLPHPSTGTPVPEVHGNTTGIASPVSIVRRFVISG